MSLFQELRGVATSGLVMNHLLTTDTALTITPSNTGTRSLPICNMSTLQDSDVFKQIYK